MKTLLVTCVIISMFGVSVIAQNGKSAKKNDDIKYLESSLDIKLKNIDSNTVYDTRKIKNIKKNILIDEKLEAYDTDNMEVSEYREIQQKLIIDKEQIEFMLQIYPELSYEHVSTWSYEECQEYIDSVNDRIFASTEGEKVQLLAKGVTLNDARYLLKYYDSYEAVIEASESELIEILSNYYQFKIDFVDYMNYVEESNNQNNLLSGLVLKANAATPPNAYIDNYVQIPSFPYYAYPNDYVHVDAGTDNQYTIRTQSIQAVNLFHDIFGQSATPKFTNIWGAYSSYSKGAHEGIDMVGSSGASIKNPISGTGIVKTPSSSALVVQKDSTVSSSYDRSFFFLHMTNRTTLSSVSKGTSLGKQGNVGNGDGGAHLHFAAEKGLVTGTHSAKNNHNLDSANPYSYSIY